MNSQISRRQLARLGIGAVLGALELRPALALPVPAEKTYLTVSGKIANANDEKGAVFDRPMLEALGMHTIETTTPWYNGVVRFEGIMMESLMTAVGASGETVKAIALNDFTTEIPVADFARYGVLLALRRDGNYMPVRDKGPLFIVYPYDANAELHSQRFYSRSAWQLAALVVQ